MKSGKHWGTVFSSQMNLLNLDSPPATHIPVSWSSVQLVFYMWYKEHFYEHHKCAIGHQLQKGGGVYIYTTQ